MSSVEKKQAQLNTAFGIVGGLVMGGPAGAIAAGMTGVALCRLEEQKDRELRQKQAERRESRKYDQKKRYEINRATDANIVMEYNEAYRLYNNEGIDSWRSKRGILLSSLKRHVPIKLIGCTEEQHKKDVSSYYMHTNPYAVRISYDYNRNISNDCRDIVDTKERPYVNIIVFKNKYDDITGIYSPSDIPIVIGKGQVYELDDFLMLYNNDKDDPNIEIFDFNGNRSRKYCRVYNGGDTYPSGLFVNYIYTIDRKNYVIGALC